jgi:hypothetical protein
LVLETRKLSVKLPVTGLLLLITSSAFLYFVATYREELSRK